MKRQLLFYVLLVLCPMASALADRDDRLDHFLSLSLEDLVNLESSIAASTKNTVAESPAVVTVITREDIRATGATNLVDVLEGIPGIHIRYSQFGFRPLIHFRGAKATQTLLMINGTPMKDLVWTFSIFWKGLPSSAIERIEIIRGPGSALFGANASAGVINVITRTAGKIEQSEAAVRLGSFNTQTAWMQYGSEWNDFDIGVTAEISSTDGHAPFIISDRQTQTDQDFGTDVSYAPDKAQYGWRNADLRLSIARDHWRVHADYMRHSDLQTGLTGAGVLDPVTEAEDSRLNVDLLYSNATLSKHWGLDATLRMQHLDYTSGDGFQERPPGYTDADGTYPEGLINLMRSAERRSNFEASGLYRGMREHTLRLGAGYTRQELYSVQQYVNFGTGADGSPINPGDPLQDLSDTPFAFAPERTRKIAYTFIQDIWNISADWGLTVGARYDDYSDFGSTTNPRLALVWQSTPTLTSKLMYGQAFRAPSYQELFAETSFTLPNADLDPERSETWDLAFLYRATTDVNVNLNLFYFKQTDIISAVTVSGLPKRQYQNTGEHVIRGIELEVQWQLRDDIRIAANYTLRDQDDSVFRAIQEPDQEAYARFDWRFRPNWNWNLQSNWIDERPRPPGDTRTSLVAYHLTDTTLRYTGIKNWEFAASIRNLFDVDTCEYTGPALSNDLPLPERNVYAEIRHNF